MAERDKPKGKSVLLFSGGMDSVMLNHIYRPDVLLYLAHGQQYEQVELEHLGNRYSNLIIDRSLRLGHMEREDSIIPGRNALFILQAARYGERILCGFLDDDRPADKSEEFLSEMTGLLNLLYRDQNWCEQRRFSVVAPAKHYTKTELVRAYLDLGGSKGELWQSYSCYRGKGKPCGWCKACLRKWVALCCNDALPDQSYWEWNPVENPELKRLAKLIASGERDRGREDRYLMKAYERACSSAG